VGLADALEFAAGDDVEAGSLLSQKTEDGEGGVGFDGVADRVGTRLGAMPEGIFEELKALSDLLRGVNVKRGRISFGERSETDSIALQRAVAIDERTGIGRGGLLLVWQIYVLFDADG
jgi:hypothetical protein